MLGIGKNFKNYFRNKKFKKDNIYCDNTVSIGKNVIIENNVSLGKSTTIECNVSIGRYSYIGMSGYVYSDVIIGRFCSIAVNVVIGAASHPLDWLSSSPFQYNKDFPIFNDLKKNLDYLDSKETIIGNDVWIGANVCIKKGITIGNGAIIGAGAVVTKDIPAYAIVGGVPAKILRYRFDTKVIEKLLRLKWWDKDIKELKGMPFNNIDECISRLDNISH